MNSNSLTSYLVGTWIVALKTESKYTMNRPNGTFALGVSHKFTPSPQFSDLPPLLLYLAA